MTTNKYPSTHITKALAYPLNFSSLVLILCASMFITIAIMDLVLAVVVVTGLSLFSLWFIKYAFSLLIHTAEGNSDAPDFGDTIIRPLEDFRPAKLIIVLVTHAMIIGNLFVLDHTLGFLSALVSFALLPAIISSLAMENKLHKAFDANEIISIIQRSGKSYWVSFSFYCMTTLLLKSVYISGVGLFLSVLITLYLILVSFHIIGITLYINRRELGFVTAHSPEQDADDINEEKIKRYQRMSTNIYSRYRQPSALPYLIEQLKTENITAYDWFYEEIMTWDIKPKFKRLFMQIYFSKLCETDLLKKTHEVYEDYIKLDPEFIIEDNIARLCLLKSALAQSDNALIKRLSPALLSESNDKESHQQTLLLLLPYFIEQEPNNKKAQQLLDIIDKHHPNLISNKTLECYRTVVTSSTNI